MAVDVKSYQMKSGLDLNDPLLKIGLGALTGGASLGLSGAAGAVAGGGMGALSSSNPELASGMQTAMAAGNNAISRRLQANDDRFDPTLKYRGR
jgi:dihydrodipicolinate synthase/N-acetylneuraminate lyase